jgi:glutathione synthase/RimK-type ligase-like ATP-grasp enzyme
MEKDPFSTFGIKRSVYHDFFRLGIERGFDMYIASGKENYSEKMIFSNAYQYNGKFFEPTLETLKMDAVFDRSGGMSFPPENISHKVLNDIYFKRLCNNKNETRKLIGDFMPKSEKIENKSELLEQLEIFSKSSLMVLKPAKGMCGKGIVIDNPGKIAEENIKEGNEYILQEFVDTSKGILGIIDGYHDLRIVIVNGRIVLSHVRTPKEGSLLANVAQGGSIKEIPIKDIPEFIIGAVKKIQILIDEKFDYPLYSIDLGIQNGKEVFIFELNDQIGFPSEQMKAKEIFLENIMDSLEKRVLAEC